MIDAAWDGFIDLRANPSRVSEISETKLLSALAGILVRLNGAACAVWTAKCDVWRPQGLDADELDARAVDIQFALACYLDLLPRDHAQWIAPEAVEARCREICRTLHSVPIRCCRADLVVRRAFITQEQETLGITAYLVACGATDRRAEAVLTTALSALADSL